MSWGVTPSSTKGGDPVYPFTLEHLQTLPSDRVTWFGGAVVIPDVANGNYKLCDAANSTLAGIGIAGISGKLDTDSMGSLFLPPCIVYSQYKGQAPLKVGSYAATAINGLWEGTQNQAQAFAQILGKAGQGGGGTDPMTDIVTDQYVKLRLFDNGGAAGPQ